MQPIDPVELSAYLDGELEPIRAREVAAALATDSSLRSQYDALASADVAWKTAAETAQFEIQLEKPEAIEISPTILAIVLVVLCGLWLMSKIDGIMGLSLALHSVALMIALPWIVRMARDNQNQL